MSDFRDRFGVQLSAASAALGAVGARDFRVRLGIQLTRAAAELAASRSPLGAPARRPAALRLPRRFLPRLSRPIAVGLSLTAFAGTAFAGLALWTPLLGDSRFGEAPPSISATTPPGDQLAALGVLRREQTSADRNGALASGALHAINASSSGVRTNYIRVLRGGTGSSGFVLVPVAERRASLASPAALPDALCVYSAASGAFAVNCYSLAEIRSGTAREVAFGQVFGLAPDGVAAVTITTPAGLRVSAPVSNNFFDAPLPPGPPSSPTVTFSS